MPRGGNYGGGRPRKRPCLEGSSPDNLQKFTCTEYNTTNVNISSIRTPSIDNNYDDAIYYNSVYNKNKNINIINDNDNDNCSNSRSTRLQTQPSLPPQQK
eukprot:Awhi_evm1s15693